MLASVLAGRLVRWACLLAGKWVLLASGSAGKMGRLVQMWKELREMGMGKGTEGVVR